MTDKKKKIRHGGSYEQRAAAHSSVSIYPSFKTQQTNSSSLIINLCLFMICGFRGQTTELRICETPAEKMLITKKSFNFSHLLRPTIRSILLNTNVLRRIIQV